MATNRQRHSHAAVNYGWDALIPNLDALLDNDTCALLAETRAVREALHAALDRLAVLTATCDRQAEVIRQMRADIRWRGTNVPMEEM